MRLNALTISRVTPWLTVAVGLLADSVQAQTFTPEIGLNPQRTA